MKTEQFDYYIFIDYSEDYLGYLIIEREKIKEFLPKISKFAHYRELKNKSAYLKSIKRIYMMGYIFSNFSFPVPISLTLYFPFFTSSFPKNMTS